MKRPTAKQLEVLEFIKTFKSENDYSPTFADIQQHFGYSSIEGASYHVNALIRKGLLRKTPNVSRSLVPICFT